MEEDGHTLCREREKRLQQKMNLLQKAVLTSQQTCSKVSFELRAAQQERLKLIEQSTICQENFRQLQDDYKRISDENYRYKDKMKRYIAHNVELRDRLGKLHQINEFLVKSLENYKNSIVKEAVGKNEQEKSTTKRDDTDLNHSTPEKERNIREQESITKDNVEERISEKGLESDDNINYSDANMITVLEDKNTVNETCNLEKHKDETRDVENVNIGEDVLKETTENEKQNKEIIEKKITKNKVDEYQERISPHKNDIKQKLEKHFAAALSKAKIYFQETSINTNDVPLVLSTVNDNDNDDNINEEENERDGEASENKRNKTVEDESNINDSPSDIPRIEIQDISDEESNSCETTEDCDKISSETGKIVSAEDESVTSGGADIMKYITKNFKSPGKKMDCLCACSSNWCMHRLLKGCNVKSELV